MELNKTKLAIKIFQWAIVILWTLFLIMAITSQSTLGTIIILFSIAIIFPPFDNFIYPKIDNWLKNKQSKLKPNLFRFLSSIVFMLFGIIITAILVDTIPFTFNSSLPDGKITTKNEIIFTGEVNDKNIAIEINNEVVDIEKSNFEKNYPLKIGLNNFNIVFKNKNNVEETREYKITRLTEEQLAAEMKKKTLEEERLKKAEEKAKEIADRNKKIESQFSPWDGSHKTLEKLIKQNMNDPDSYEHVKTVYWDKGNYLIVSTTFRGKNAFGGKVLNTIKANISLDGQILKVIQ